MDLRERLADVADELTELSPPRGLWDDTQRRRAGLRRQAQVVVAVAAVAISVILVGSWRSTRPPEPLAPTGQTSLPDRFFTPSPWLPGTDEAGPLGQLIGVLEADRRSWRGVRSGVVGVSASTGEYRFLDLPGLPGTGEGGIALSPAGTELAYWAIGPTSGTPNDRQGSVGSLVVYDTATGALRRADIPSPHGLAMPTAFFVDDQTLVATFSRYRAGYDGSAMDRSSATDSHTIWWRLSEPAPAPAGFAEGNPPDGGPAARAGRYWTSWSVDHGSVLVDLTRKPVSHHLASPESWAGLTGSAPEGALTPDGRRLAILASNEETGRVPNRVRVFDLATGEGRLVPDSGETFAVVSWLNPDKVAAFRGTPDPHNDDIELVSMDVRTGTDELLTRAAQLDITQWFFALDLLDSPVVPAVAPPTPWDPRLVVGSVAGIVLLTGNLLWWRRRSGVRG